jgi:hypothetical protein
MSLFQNIVLKKHLAADSDKIAAAYSRFAEYFLNPEMPRIILLLCQQEEWADYFNNTTTYRVRSTQITTGNQQASSKADLLCELIEVIEYNNN